MIMCFQQGIDVAYEGMERGDNSAMKILHRSRCEKEKQPMGA